MKHPLSISNVLEEVSSLSLSIVFFYFFALLIYEGLLIFPFLSSGTLHSLSVIETHYSEATNSEKSILCLLLMKEALYRLLLDPDFRPHNAF